MDNKYIIEKGFITQQIREEDIQRLVYLKYDDELIEQYKEYLIKMNIIGGDIMDSKEFLKDRFINGYIEGMY